MRKCLALLLTLFLMLTLCVGCTHADSGAVVPDLTIARRPIPENEAMAFLKKMGVGWNLGNTFDATKNNWNRNADEMTVETSWVGIKTTEAMI